MKYLTVKFIFLQSILLIMSYGHPISTPRHVFSSINSRIENHPGHSPFPTDMTFRKFADHIIDQSTESFDPDLVQKGDSIYLADFYIAWFTKYVHPQIKHPYILISNDSDCSHPESGVWDYNEKWGWSPPVNATRTLLYDSKVAAWFCKNMIISKHPKIIQIPIGQTIIYWSSEENIKYKELDELCILHQQIQEKKHLLYMNMQTTTHPIRPLVSKLFIDHPYCLSRMTGLSKRLFYKELSEAKFVVAPPGYGPDTVRFWEAITLNCIPIVQHSDLDDLYSDLPALFINNWEEISEDFLNAKQIEILNKKFSTEKAYFPYWANKITEYQEQVRNNQNEFSSISATKFKQETLKTLLNVLKTNSSPKDKLLCIGAVMGLRPFELAQKSLFKTIYVQDQWGAWGHEKATNHLIPFSNDPLFKNSLRIIPLNYYENPYAICKSTEAFSIHVFFDLAYRRHPLIIDLETAYISSAKGTLICGSMAEDCFIKKVLEKFSEKHEIQIHRLEDVWFFKK